MQHICTTVYNAPAPASMDAGQHLQVLHSCSQAAAHHQNKLLLLLLLLLLP
jgi:hypothetical protein